MSREHWDQELGDVAREEAREADAWWDAANRGDGTLLPNPAPTVDALRPIDDAERARMTEALMTRIPAPAVRQRPRRMWIAGAAAMAIAAGVAAIALRAPMPNIPSYSIEVASGDRTWRSTEAPVAKTPQYRTGSRMEIVLQPETAAEVAPQVSAELVGKRTVAWPTPIERGRGGTFRLLAEVGTELALEPGPWKLMIAIGGAAGSRQHLEYAFEVAGGP